MQELLGEGHRRLLDMLCERVGSIAGGDETLPRMVILEGVSGIGKTRVVRELYRRLCSRLDQENYWPGIDESCAYDGGDPLSFRKSMGPEVDQFIWPAGALPGFGWWQLHCERMRSGHAIDVVGQARPEIQAHLLPVALAWRRAASMKEKFGAKRADLALAARAALEEGGFEAATQVLANFGVVIPGLSTAASWAFSGAKAARRRKEVHLAATNEVALGERTAEQRRSASAELAELIVGVSHPRVAGVVVIEDLHLMDQALVDFLNHLSRRRNNHPVLVVATAWPENRSLGVYGEWSAVEIREGRVERIGMPSLGLDDLREIVWSFAPNTSHEIATSAARFYPNPLVLEAVLSSPRVRTAVKRGEGSLPSEAIAGQPPAIAEIYRDRFRHLSPDVQQALAVAAGSLPDPGSSQMSPFVREIVAEAAQRCGDLASNTDDVVRGIETAAQEKVWLIPDEGADWFREALYAHIAFEHLSGELLLPKDVVRLQELVFDVLSDWIDKERGGGYLLDSDSKTGIMSRWLIELAMKQS